MESGEVTWRGAQREMERPSERNGADRAEPRAEKRWRKWPVLACRSCATSHSLLAVIDWEAYTMSEEADWIRIQRKVRESEWRLTASVLSLRDPALFALLPVSALAFPLVWYLATFLAWCEACASAGGECCGRRSAQIPRWCTAWPLVAFPGLASRTGSELVDCTHAPRDGRRVLRRSDSIAERVCPLQRF